MDKYKAYFDGAVEPMNPGGTPSVGVVVFKNFKRVHEFSGIPTVPGGQKATVNFAEYEAFLMVLIYFMANDLLKEDITVYGDSKLVIEQMFGTWSINEGVYVQKAHEAQELMKKFTNLKGQWIPREQNAIADRFSKQVLIDAGIPITDYSQYKKKSAY